MPDTPSDAVAAPRESPSAGAVQALKNASLQVGAGQVVALMGANGAGKSTFVKILTGVLKPDAGHVKIKGRESTVSNPAGARKWGLIAGLSGTFPHPRPFHR